MDLDLLPACQLTWSENRKVTSVDGACARVLGREAQALVGLWVHQALGLGELQASLLDQQVRREERVVAFVQARCTQQPTTLRVSLALREAQVRCSVVDADAFLVGAPPLQIARLSSSLSHEIRNPLSSVKMAVQTLARNTGLSERDQRRLAIANREIRTMERMLGLLSEYGRESSATKEPIPLRTVLQDAVSLVQPELTERRTQVELEGPPDLPKVRVDALRVRLVLAQFLLNVAMGLPEDASLKVELRPGPDGGTVMQVRDEAASVLPEERVSLFEPFGSRLARGAGLSLAALRRALNSQGAEVSVEPLPGEGALFTLTFPA